MSGARQLLGAMTVCFALLLATATGVTMSGFASGAVSNSTDSAAVGSLSFQHAYQSTSCTLIGALASSTSCAGSIVGTDVITNLGSAPATRLNEQASAATCGVVQLKNSRGSDANPMLPRYATTFQAADPWGSGNAIALDGSTAYTSDVVSQTQPNPLISLGALYGVGIWFKTASTTGGPLFEIGNNATASAGGDDRLLYLTAAGKVSFIQNTTGSSTTSPGSYNDGQWHFAYVTMSALNLILGLTSTTTLYVDGTAVATGGGLLIGYGADTGYWHLGWAPASVTGLASSYFAGSLSNFVVFDNAGAPAAPTSAQRVSQAAFSTWAASSTEQWLLADDGTTSGATPAYPGPWPVIGSTSPCSMLDIAWSMTNPVGTVTTATPLSSFANGTWHSVPAPGPGQAQTSTITVNHDPTYNGYVSGLHLYAPLSMRVQTVPASSWSLTFGWPSVSATFIA